MEHIYSCSETGYQETDYYASDYARDAAMEAAYLAEIEDEQNAIEERRFGAPAPVFEESEIDRATRRAPIGEVA